MDYFVFEKLNGLAFGVTYIDMHWAEISPGYARTALPRKSTERKAAAHQSPRFQSNGQQEVLSRSLGTLAHARVPGPKTSQTLRLPAHIAASVDKSHEKPKQSHHLFF
jgi:hypothetical protein